MKIVPIYSSSVTTSTVSTQYQQAVTAAITTLTGLYFDPITINIQFGFGEILGTPMSPSSLGESEPYYSGYYTPSQIVTYLTAVGTSATDTAAIAHFPAGTVGNGYVIVSAQEKAFGITAANGTNIDGYVSLSSSLPFTWDNTNGVTSGTYDAIGTLMHEITEIMGRVSALPWGINAVSILDGFRYSGGVWSPAIGAAYFSIDGGVTNLKGYNSVSGGDPADWDSSVNTDPVDAFANAGIKQIFSAVDIIEVDAIGYSTVVVSGSAPSAPSSLTAKAAVVKKGHTTTTTVALAWSQSGSPTSNQIYRSVSSGSFTLLATISAATSYSDKSVSSGKTYAYYVKSVNNFGTSSASNTATVST